MVALERASALPLRAQLEQQLREGARAGRLAPGAALPSTRALARELGVARGVVSEAYAQLAAEGYLVARQGAPTRVAERAPVAPPAVTAPGAAPRTRFDFRPGAPDVALFPRAAWSAAMRQALREAPDLRFEYGGRARGARAAQRARELPRARARRGGGAGGGDRRRPASRRASPSRGGCCAAWACGGSGSRSRGAGRSGSSSRRRGSSRCPSRSTRAAWWWRRWRRAQPRRCSARRPTSSRPAWCSRRTGAPSCSPGRRTATRTCSRTTTTPSTATTGRRSARCRGSIPSG